ncbi:MAG: response regulator transcription factor, partial [bacterium]|nr:response regulator transcription factor [bacterium]
MDKDNIDEKKDTIRVTIVDDEKLFLKVVRLNLLQSIGSFPNYEMVVETFPHGEALLERPDTVAGTDVFIVDEVLGAGRMRGRELIPKLRELAGHARFILYSGKKITSREVGPLTLLGVDYFCPKPLDYPDIIQKIISGYRSSRLSRNLKQARNIMSHLQDDIPPAYRDTLPDTNDDSNPGITLELVRDIARRLAIRATLDNINRENTEAGIINALFSGLLDFGVGRCRYYLVNENLEVFERVNETAGHETLREQTLFSIKPNSWILDRACPEFVYGYKIFLKADSEMLSDRTEISSFPTISFLMKSEDRITGIIDIDGGETKNLGEDNIGYIKNLTNHAALAIQNARNVRLSTILSETIGRLAVKTSVKAISKEVVGLVSTILDIDSTTLFLFNREINSLEKKAAYILTKDRLEGPPESHDTEYRAGNFFISVSEAFM